MVAEWIARSALPVPELALGNSLETTERELMGMSESLPPGFPAREPQ